MPQLIDRRLNPRDKSLVNRRRFLRRTRAQIKEAVDKAVADRNVADVASDGKVSIPSRGIREPRFVHDPGHGEREYVLPGNKEYVPGDRIAKPSGGAGGRGRQASDHGEGEDEFVFTLSRDEFLDIFFEDLELPDLIKTSLKETFTYKPRRAGYTNTGTPTNMNVLRTMRNSIGRRIALRRPVVRRLEAMHAEIAELEAKEALPAHEQQRLAELKLEIEALDRRRRAVPFIDPLDIRYNRYEMQPQPKTRAVMFCLMDVSGSMGAYEKDLAKRFFVLLHLFLQRRYERVEVVFVRHTHEAQEVDEQTFFFSQETGGTVVSTALAVMRDIVRARYPTAEWNIYAAQASDGDNYGGDTRRCLEFLTSELLPISQYYAYVEVSGRRDAETLTTYGGGELWRGYETLLADWPNFSMKRIYEPSHIYPVFRELFAKKER